MFGSGVCPMRPVVVGSGVSGIFALLTMLKVSMQGLATPVAQTGKTGLPLPLMNVIAVATVARFFLEVRTHRVRPHFDFTLTIAGLLAVFAFGKVNGAHRWIKFDHFSVQPSEISKLTLAVFLAYFLEKRAGEEGDFWRTFVPCGLAAAWLAVLVVVEPDFGTALMLILIFVVVIYTAGARLAHLAMAAAPAVCRRGRSKTHGPISRAAGFR